MSKRTGTVRRLTGGIAPARPAETAPTQISADTLGELDAIGEIGLPRDHPKWLRDRFVISRTTKALLARLRPFTIRLLGFWDHRRHRLELEGGTIQIDDSGAYRSV